MIEGVLLVTSGRMIEEGVLVRMIEELQGASGTLMKLRHTNVGGFHLALTRRCNGQAGVQAISAMVYI